MAREIVKKQNRSQKRTNWSTRYSIHYNIRQRKIPENTRWVGWFQIKRINWNCRLSIAYIVSLSRILYGFVNIKFIICKKELQSAILSHCTVDTLLALILTYANHGRVVSLTTWHTNHLRVCQWHTYMNQSLNSLEQIKGPISGVEDGEQSRKQKSRVLVYLTDVLHGRKNLRYCSRSVPDRRQDPFPLGRLRLSLRVLTARRSGWRRLVKSAVGRRDSDAVRGRGQSCRLDTGLLTAVGVVRPGRVTSIADAEDRGTTLTELVRLDLKCRISNLKLAWI